MKREFRTLLAEKNRKDLPKVLLAASECAPLSKTGGLGDVVGALPKALQPLGVETRVITPYHRCIKEKYASQVEHLFYIYVDLGWRHEYAGLEKLVVDGVTVYLVDSEFFFGDSIYRGGLAEGEQYCFFTRAVLDALPLLDFAPDIIQCNDWHTSMIPFLARTQYPGGMQEKIKYLLTIHNIAFQGRFDFSFVQDLLGVDPKYYTPEVLELYGCADFMKAGIAFADKISTVSPTYAEEIKTPEYSDCLGQILSDRSVDLSGILNGIDTEVFNPAKDQHIAAHYTSRSYATGKAKCKRALQKRLGLPQKKDVPIISMVTRMTEQKGFDLILEALDSILERENCQFVLLGSGDSRYETAMLYKALRYYGHISVTIGYDDALSHQIYAGSDFLLMPSRFEPCGLSQLIAMRYGCLPIVRVTGGLKDTVIPWQCETEEGNGFAFRDYNAQEMEECVYDVLDVYSDPAAMDKLVRNAMEADFSFERSAEKYVRLYISMLEKKASGRKK